MVAAFIDERKIERTGRLDAYLDTLSEQIDQPDDPLWINPNILGIEEFVTSTEHLGKTLPLSEVQKQEIRAVLGSDPKKIFSNGSKYLIGVFLWGKGSGKDWICAIIMCYMIYILLSMKNPQLFFYMDDREPIRLVNVSGSGSKDAAVEIFFDKFKENILSWKWLQNKYAIFEQGRLYNRTDNWKAKPRIALTDGKLIIADKRIQMLSYGSDNERMEGGNVLVWLMDEASAMKDGTKLNNAKRIYSTLRTSATSRFGMRWKGFVLSYPRAEDDFTVRLYNESQNPQASTIPDAINTFSDTIYGSRFATWEVLPPQKYSGRRFTFEGMQIPVELFDDFDKYPEESKAKFACIPPAVEDAFIRYPERITACMVADRAPLLTTVDTEVHYKLEGTADEIRNYVGKLISWIRDRGADAMKVRRVIHVDGGRDDDSAALVMAHGVPMVIKMYNDKGQMEDTYVNKVVVDAIIIWKPDRARKLQVSLNSVEALILEMRKWLNIVKVSYDQWNSQSSMETFHSNGIMAVEHTIKDNDYFELKTMLYNQAVELLPVTYTTTDGAKVPNHEAGVLVQELRKLRLLNGKKVDHPNDGSKDVSDCLAGVNWLLNNVEETKQTVTGMPKPVLGMGFTRAQPTMLSPSSMGITHELPVQPGLPRTSTPQIGVSPIASVGWANDHPVPQQGPRRFPSSVPKAVLSGGGPLSQFGRGSGSQLPRHLR